ncbi:MAG TPA: hypothetical protein DCR46_02970 [Cytophagales bacterium]|nr:hypothetical protein [Cytophagales bacterium]
MEGVPQQENPQSSNTKINVHPSEITQCLFQLPPKPDLFVCVVRQNEVRIPNTTNAIDGHFAHLKSKLPNHNGHTKVREIKFIDGF